MTEQKLGAKPGNGAVGGGGMASRSWWHAALYKGRSVGSSQLNTREIILQHVAQLKDKLYEE